MALLPENTNTTMYKLNQLGALRPGRRGRSVGMSTIGQKCERRLWFAFHWIDHPEVLTNRTEHIFRTGTEAEDFVIRDLERIGIKVTQRQEELWGFGKHAHGFTDGRCINVPEAPKTEHLLEIKTHNDKSFNGVVKKGVKEAKPLHYAQMQRYMLSTKLTRALYIAYNKNTSEYYAERIRFDRSFADDLFRKEREIILAETAPARRFEEHYFECKFCPFKAHCYEDAPVNKNCRTCVFADLQDGGKWTCGFNSGNHEIPVEVQETGCHCYKPIEFPR